MRYKALDEERQEILEGDMYDLVKYYGQKIGLELKYQGYDLPIKEIKDKRRKVTKHDKHVIWRRQKIFSLLVQGITSTYDLASALHISQSTAARDVQFLKLQATEQLKLKGNVNLETFLKELYDYVAERSERYIPVRLELATQHGTGVDGRFFGF